MRHRISGITKEKLSKMYIVDRMSTKKISQHFGVDPGTIFARLKEYDIPLKTASEARTEVYISKEELERLYIQDRMTMKEIGELYSIGSATVLHKMRRYNISSRSKSESHRSLIQKEKLERLYINEKKKIREIMDIFGVSKDTIISRMREYGINARIGAPPKIDFATKEELERLYIGKNKTAVEIGKIYNVSGSIVSIRLKEYEIPIRLRNEHQIINFCNREELERLYINGNKTMIDIGKMFGVSPGVVMDRLHQYGIQVRPQGCRTSMNTGIERKMQYILQKNGYVFETHRRICGYYPDIIFRDRQILVECDGDYWHGNPLIYENFDKRQLKAHRHDKKRDKILENNGWSVIRFWEIDINNDIENCLHLFELEYFGGD